MSNERLEIKLVCDEVFDQWIEDWLAGHITPFARPYPDRWINNVYYDTGNLDCLLDNVAGLPNREKLRLRWYGLDEEPENCVMEIKKKRNKLVEKIAAPCRKFTLSQLPEIDPLALLEPDAKADLVRAAACCIQPTLMNRYHRRYFVSQDKRVRVTIDRDLSFWDMRGGGAVDHADISYKTYSTIMEFKLAPEDREICSELMAGLPLTASRCSKYAVGMQHILGQVF